MQGLKTFDEQGRIIVDVTDRLTKIIGSITLEKALTSGSGVVTHADFTQGQPFYFVKGNFADKQGYIDGNNWKHGIWYDSTTQLYKPFQELTARRFDIQFYETRMEWSFTMNNARWLPARSNCQLFYGVF